MADPIPTVEMAYVQFDVMGPMDTLEEEGTIIIGKLNPSRPLHLVAREYATMRHPGNYVRNLVTGAVIMPKLLTALVPK